MYNDTGIFDYVTEGGIAIEIELPLGSNGRILPDRYLSDKERRWKKALTVLAPLKAIRQSEQIVILESNQLEMLH